MTTTALPSIGIDIGKEVFHVVGFSTDGKIAFRRKIKRLALVETVKRLPPSIVGGGVWHSHDSSTTGAHHPVSQMVRCNHG